VTVLLGLAEGIIVSQEPQVPGQSSRMATPASTPHGHSVSQRSLGNTLAQSQSPTIFPFKIMVLLVSEFLHFVGTIVGVSVGYCDGRTGMEFCSIGDPVGESVGDFVGAIVGTEVGLLEYISVGDSDGESVGYGVGAVVGSMDGTSGQFEHVCLQISLIGLLSSIHGHNWGHLLIGFIEAHAHKDTNLPVPSTTLSKDESSSTHTSG